METSKMRSGPDAAANGGNPSVGAFKLERSVDPEGAQGVLILTVDRVARQAGRGHRLVSAEDLRQDLHLAVLEGRILGDGAVRDAVPLEAYHRGCARNLLRNCVRREARRRPRVQVTESYLPAAEPDEHVARSASPPTRHRVPSLVDDVRKVVRRSLRNRPTEEVEEPLGPSFHGTGLGERQAALLEAVERGASFREAAAVVGISYSAGREAILRAVRVLIEENQAVPRSGAHSSACCDTKTTDGRRTTPRTAVRLAKADPRSQDP